MTRGGSRRWRLVRARADAIPASVRRFNQRARRRRWRAASPWLAAALVLALGGLTGWVVYGTGLLGVRHVRVQGTSILTADEVRRAARVAPGSPLASLDLVAVRHRVEALPPVHDAGVTRDWPSTIVISVRERTAIAVVPRGGDGYGLLDASGVLYTAVPVRPAGLPQVRLADPGPGDATTQAALAVLGALTAELRQLLVTLVADAPTRIRLDLLGGRQVVWGDATDNAKKARVATSVLGYPGSIIDVSAPDVVTMR